MKNGINKYSNTKSNIATVELQKNINFERLFTFSKRKLLIFAIKLITLLISIYILNILFTPFFLRIPVYLSIRETVSTKIEDNYVVMYKGFEVLLISFLFFLFFNNALDKKIVFNYPLKYKTFFNILSSILYGLIGIINIYFVINKTNYNFFFIQKWSEILLTSYNIIFILFWFAFIISFGYLSISFLFFYRNSYFSNKIPILKPIVKFSLSPIITFFIFSFIYLVQSKLSIFSQSNFKSSIFIIYFIFIILDFKFKKIWNNINVLLDRNNKQLNDNDSLNDDPSSYDKKNKDNSQENLEHNREDIIFTNNLTSLKNNNNIKKNIKSPKIKVFYLRNDENFEDVSEEINFLENNGYKVLHHPYFYFQWLLLASSFILISLGSIYYLRYGIPGDSWFVLKPLLTIYENGSYNYSDGNMNYPILWATIVYTNHLFLGFSNLNVEIILFLLSFYNLFLVYSLIYLIKPGFRPSQLFLSVFLFIFMGSFGGILLIFKGIETYYFYTSLPVFFFFQFDYKSIYFFIMFFSFAILEKHCFILKRINKIKSDHNLVNQTKEYKQITFSKQKKSPFLNLKNYFFERSRIVNKENIRFLYFSNIFLFISALFINIVYFTHIIEIFLSILAACLFIIIYYRGKERYFSILKLLILTLTINIIFDYFTSFYYFHLFKNKLINEFHLNLDLFIPDFILNNIETFLLISLIPLSVFYFIIIYYEESYYQFSSHLRDKQNLIKKKINHKKHQIKKVFQKRNRKINLFIKNSIAISLLFLYIKGIFWWMNNFDFSDKLFFINNRYSIPLQYLTMQFSLIGIFSVYGWFSFKRKEDLIFSLVFVVFIITLGDVWWSSRVWRYLIIFLIILTINSIEYISLKLAKAYIFVLKKLNIIKLKRTIKNDKKLKRSLSKIISSIFIISIFIFNFPSNLIQIYYFNSSRSLKMNETVIDCIHTINNDSYLENNKSYYNINSNILMSKNELTESYAFSSFSLVNVIFLEDTNIKYTNIENITEGLKIYNITYVFIRFYRGTPTCPQDFYDNLIQLNLTIIFNKNGFIIYKTNNYPLN